MSDPNSVYIDNCCGCGCAHRIEQVAISRPGQDVVDYLNCYAVSGGACGTLPQSNETTLRNVIDLIWPELMAIDFDSPPIAFGDPNGCADQIFRTWGYDSGAGGYVETWQTNNGLGFSQAVDDSGSATGITEIPTSGVANETFAITTGGPLWQGNQITVVRTRIHYSGSLCLSTRECDTNTFGGCGVGGDTITSILACGSVSDTGGLIYSTHDPAFNPQDIVFTANGFPPPGFLQSSLYEIIWFGAGVDGSGGTIWEAPPCVDCTCP